MRKTVVLFPSSVVLRLSSLACLSVICLLSSIHAHANNIAVSNLSLTGHSTSAGTVNVQFDISWDNSWRSSTNYDAAWVFIKYSTDSGTTWAHATLKASGTNPAGFSRGTGTTLDIVVPADLKGAFFQKSANGTGTVNTTDVELVWDWNANGLSASTAARVKVFAVEMVYIPTGSFYVGSGGSETSAFYTYPTAANAYLISSEAAIDVGTTTDYLYYNLSTWGGDQSGPIPADFPKGYNAFYIMKYECSEGQWIDFFNTLTAAQKVSRDVTDSNGKNQDTVYYRNTVAWTTGDATTTRQDRACNLISCADLSAYADWAGLRPFTELEFEKAARGDQSPVANEYPWGSTAITAAITISGAEDGTETITTAGANCAYGFQLLSGGDGDFGSLRCGIFAKSGTTRAQAGASYYGVMELTGNLHEIIVTAGNETARSFTGLHGDGALDADGNADVANWPTTYMGYRGSAWDLEAVKATVSCRIYTSYYIISCSRSLDSGIRCVRTAP